MLDFNYFIRFLVRPMAEITAGLGEILRLPGFRFSRGDKRRFLRALDLWSTHPNLGFADALIATTAMLAGAEIATFDHHFGRVQGLTRWQPRGSSPCDGSTQR